MVDTLISGPGGLAEKEANQEMPESSDSLHEECPLSANFGWYPVGSL